MDSTFRANEVFIPVVFLEAGASETLVCSRAKRAQSELEALFAPRRVEGSQRNFLDSKRERQRTSVRGVKKSPAEPSAAGLRPFS